MATTVGSVIDNARRILQERGADGVRWTNAELLDWLNEAYAAIVQIRPDASSASAEITLEPGTRQRIPEDGIRLLDVIRSTAGDGMSVMVIARRDLNAMRRRWHSDPPSLDIEHYVFDEEDPKHFYVYPPAATGATVEIVYSIVPTGHDATLGLEGLRNEAIRLDDTYGPVLTDYVLYRAFSKDAEHGANLNRAQMHLAAVSNSLGQTTQIDRALSPNAAQQG